MPKGTVLDFSGWRPTWQDYTNMVAWGIVGVVRYPYLGPGTEWKAMQKDEYDRTLSFGLSVAFTPELAADTWRGGEPKGRIVGRMAREWVHNLGFPDTRCLHFAVDTNVFPVDLNLALDYLHGCAVGAGGRQESAYGETSVIDAAFRNGITCNGWRAAATSWDTNPSQYASMRQTTQRSYPFSGAYDENIISRPDWGQHPFSGGTMPLPYTLWQTDPGPNAKVWRVDAAGQSKILVPDLQQIAWNFDRLKEYGATASELMVRDAVGEGRRWIDAIPVSGSFILPPLPPYPVPPTPAEIAKVTLDGMSGRLGS